MRTIYKKQRKNLIIFKKQEIHDKDFYQNELDKACFQHDEPHGNFKDLTRTTASDKILSDKAFNIGENRKYEVYKCFDKKTSVGAIKNKITSTEKLAGEIHKHIIRKFEKGKVNSSFIGNTWGADFADM